MKKLWLVMLVLFAGFLFFGCEEIDDNGNGNGDPVPLDEALAAEFEGVFEGKTIYMTAIGLGPEISNLNLMFNNFVGVEAGTVISDQSLDEESEDGLLTAADIPTGGIVILIPGASGKGMGAAGIDEVQEKARAEGFSTRALAGEIELYIVHNGGEERRGVSSDLLISASVPGAKLMIIIAGGNTDDYFKTLSTTHDVPLYTYTITMAMVNPFKQLFGIAIE